MTYLAPSFRLQIDCPVGLRIGSISSVALVSSSRESTSWSSKLRVWIGHECETGSLIPANIQNGGDHDSRSEIDNFYLSFLQFLADFPWAARR